MLEEFTVLWVLFLETGLEAAKLPDLPRARLLVCLLLIGCIIDWYLVVVSPPCVSVFVDYSAGASSVFIRIATIESLVALGWASGDLVWGGAPVTTVKVEILTAHLFYQGLLPAQIVVPSRCCGQLIFQLHHLLPMLVEVGGTYLVERFVCQGHFV